LLKAKFIVFGKEISISVEIIAKTYVINLCNLLLFKVDNVIKKLKNQLPSNQMNTMVSSMDQFQVLLQEQRQFRPFGVLLSKFDFEGKEMQVYKISEGNEAFNKYLARVQTLALWYIEGAEYTDNDDSRWNHYFVYEAIKRPDDIGYRYILAGYSSVVNFYCHPFMVRTRIAQFLVLPQYRGKGNGSRFLQSIYNDLISRKEVKDVTVEDPSDKFMFMRDFIDCRNCAQLIEFSADNLKKGFSIEMKEAAQKKLKINPRQARRVYEILRLMKTDVRNEQELKDYRIDVKRRLEQPFKKSERDWNRLKRALNDEEMATVIANQTNIEKKIDTLRKLYDSLILDYKIVIDRLKIFTDLS
uniref:Histone acetyltransferase type B catalytic subunit n=1 Tax=Dracunculus medinensis TaxID=318479 RepID=A0A0N4UAD9_DRAME